MPSLLAVDLGLRAGLALYGADGRLLRARSTNFGTISRLKKGCLAVLDEAPEPHFLVLEGDRHLAEIWERAAARREVQCLRVSPERWRERLLIPRERRKGSQAKEAAGRLADQIFAFSGLSRPASLRHDAAEAILIGLWGLLEVGWLPELPDELRRG